MCKGCQYCLESCYWHLIEKRFCYDESIALYEEPSPKKEPLRSNNISFENMAFYDQVSLIAGRAIVTIDPLPKQQKPIEHQPQRRLRWWEDSNVDPQIKKNETKNPLNQNKIVHNPIPTIKEDSKENLTDSMENLDSIIKEKVEVEVTDNSKKKDEVKSDEKNEITPIMASLSVDDVPVKLRKKSLRERRMSRSLTLHIDRNLELPVIRQLSMPKFYIDTPESNQKESSILVARSATLTSPIMPRNQFDFFDLRSVVQIENEHRAHSIHHHNHHHHHHHHPHVPVHRQMSQHSRLSHIREKLKPLKIRRQGSATNLPNSIQHI